MLNRAFGALPCPFATRTTSQLPESPPAAPTDGSTCGTARTSANTRAAGRTACTGCACAWKTSVSSRGAGFAQCRPSPALPSLPCLSFDSWFQTLVNLFSQRLSPERHSQMLQQQPRLVVIRRRGHDGDIHSLLLVDLFVGNFRKDQLVMQSHRVVAPAVERFGRDPLEITHSRQHDVHQPVKKF